MLLSFCCQLQWILMLKQGINVKIHLDNFFIRVKAYFIRRICPKLYTTFTRNL